MDNKQTLVSSQWIEAIQKSENSRTRTLHTRPLHPYHTSFHTLYGSPELLHSQLLVEPILVHLVQWSLLPPNNSEKRYKQTNSYCLNLFVFGSSTAIPVKVLRAYPQNCQTTRRDEKR